MSIVVSENTSLDRLLEEFGLDEKYKGRVLRHLVSMAYPASYNDLETIGLGFDEYLFGEPFQKLGFDIDEVKANVKRALAEPEMAVIFHKYARHKGTDISLFYEYLDNPNIEELNKGREGKYGRVRYLLTRLMFDREGRPFSSQFLQSLSATIKNDYTHRIDTYMEDPLAIINYLFWNEGKNVELELKNHEQMPNDNPVWAGDLDFYYRSELIKSIKVITKPTYDYKTSLNAYLDIREWYGSRQKKTSQIIIPVEFPFGELGTIRKFYEFRQMPIPVEAMDEMREGVRFLSDKGSLYSIRTEYHLNAEMSPPALIIIDFEYEGGGS